MRATCISSICFLKNYNLHAKFMILMYFNLFSFFSLQFFLEMFLLLLFTLGIFIPFFFLYLILYIVFWRFILHRLRKWCFIVAIATLFYFLAMLKISLRSYIFFVDVYNLYYL